MTRPTLRVGLKDAALRQARTCYHHLTGALGVSIADALCASGTVEIDGDAAALSDAGRAQMQALGILTRGNAPRGTRPVSGPCLD